MERRPDVEVDVQIPHALRRGADASAGRVAALPRCRRRRDLPRVARNRARGTGCGAWVCAAAEVPRAADRIRIFADADTPPRRFATFCSTASSRSRSRCAGWRRCTRARWPGRAARAVARWPRPLGRRWKVDWTRGALLARRGSRPCSVSDCLAIERDGDRVLAVPASPGLRLWPGLLARGRPRTRQQPTAPVAHYSTKRRVTPRRGAPAGRPLPLRAPSSCSSVRTARRRASRRGSRAPAP